MKIKSIWTALLLAAPILCLGNTPVAYTMEQIQPVRDENQSIRSFKHKPSIKKQDKTLHPRKTISLANGEKLLRFPYPSAPSVTSTLSYKPGEVLVSIQDTFSVLAVDDTLEQLQFTIKKDLSAKRRSLKTASHGQGKRTLLLHSSKVSAKEMIRQLTNNPMVDAVSLNYRHSINITPNDPSYTEQWAFKNTGQDSGTAGVDINAETAWNTHTGSVDSVTAVLDTGIVYNHPDLLPNMWMNSAEASGTANFDDDGNGLIDDIYGYDFAYNDSDPFDGHGHGTHVAGTIAAIGNNSLGVTGVNWIGRVMAVKVMDDSGNGDDAAVIEAVNYVIAMKLDGVNIVAINGSFGGGGYNQLVKDVIDVAGAEGIIFAAAAGNDDLSNDATPHYPSSYISDNILSVANTDRNDKLATGSCYGLTSVDLGAPGQGILSTSSWLEHSPDPTLFLDDLESGFGNWTGNVNWQLTTEQFASTSHAWSDSPLANSDNDSYTFLYSPAINLSGVTTPKQVGFSLRWDLETDADYFEVYLKNYVVPVPGSWEITTETASSGTYSWSDSPSGGNYTSNEDNRLISPVINIASSSSDVALNFSFTGHVEEDWDFFDIYMSGDGGSSWFYITSFTGDYSSSWQSTSIKIDTAYRTTNFRFALAIFSDDSIEYDGMHVDDVTVTDSSPATYFSDNMESGFGFWTTSKTSAEVWSFAGEITGSSSENWYLITEDLNPQNYFDGFQVAFAVKTDDNGVTGDGVYIDDISVGEAVRVYGYRYLSGTSMATPHVAGSVALLASQYPNESFSKRIDRILNTVDQTTALSGKTVTGGRLNLAKAMSQQNFPWMLLMPAFSHK